MTEGPYKLPEGWRWVKLGEVVKECFSGGTPSTKEKSFWNGDIPWITSASISEDDVFLKGFTQKISEKGIQNSASKIAPVGSVIVGSRVGVGKAVVATFDVAINQDLTALILESHLSPQFVVYLFKASTMKAELEKITRGATIKGITRRELLSINIPLPPLEEQRRIVARIEELMECIREARHLRQKAREDTERLWQATLADLFPRPGTALPSRWRWVKLGEVASKPQYGYSKSATSDPIGPKFVRITDISAGEIDWDKVPYCECDMRTLEKYRLYPGEVLFARSGSIGATILLKETPGDAVFASYLIRVKFREEVIPEFADLVLKAPVCQLQLVPQGAAQKNINAKLIERILIPLPPLEEQRRIVAHLEEVEEKVQSLKEGQVQVEAELQRLEHSILNAAFRGEL